MTERRAAVWPLVEGLDALNAIGQPVKTKFGTRCFLPMSTALNLTAQGKVQMLAGKRPQELAQEPAPPPPDLDSVVDEDPPPRRTVRPKRTYKRRDVTAETK